MWDKQGTVLWKVQLFCRYPEGRLQLSVSGQVERQKVEDLSLISAIDLKPRPATN